MKNKLMDLTDKILLRKRSITETIKEQLKNISQIEHTRHRRCTNFMINLLCVLIAYTYQTCNPSIKNVYSIDDAFLTRIEVYSEKGRKLEAIRVFLEEREAMFLEEKYS